MPRGARLDAPGVVHHVMARGLNRQPIFRDDQDRDDLVRRLAALAVRGDLVIYAWALLPNHLHLLVRTGVKPLSRGMRSLLTGYAGTFNRRHRRAGHLFQNRYRSIVVEEEPYLLELVRYLHLNPLRAGAVDDLKALDAYPYSGHAAIMGTQVNPWQEIRQVLGLFDRNERSARRRYRQFVAEGIPLGRRPELMGGGLIRSAGGWTAVEELRRGREGFASDERILGDSDFVEGILRQVEREEAQRDRFRRKLPSLDALLQRVADHAGVSAEALAGGGRRRAVSRAREGLAYLWVELLGRSGRALAVELGIRPESILRAARRGGDESARWRKLLE